MFLCSSYCHITDDPCREQKFIPWHIGSTGDCRSSACMSELTWTPLIFFLPWWFFQVTKSWPQQSKIFFKSPNSIPVLSHNEEEPKHTDVAVEKYILKSVPGGDKIDVLLTDDTTTSNVDLPCYSVNFLLSNPNTTSFYSPVHKPILSSVDECPSSSQHGYWEEK